MENLISSIQNIVIIGIGGTGGYIVPNIARIMATMNPMQRPKLTLIDPDLVEEKNLIRQNFIYTDIGRPKAKVLAERYSGAFGLTIDYIIEKFDYQIYQSINCMAKTVLMIEAVDNHKTRFDIHLFTENCNSRWFSTRGAFALPLIWLSCGNTDVYGQVICGPFSSIVNLYASDFTTEALEQEATRMQHENCAAHAIQNPQNIAVNLTAATIAVNMTYELLTTKKLINDIVHFDKYNNICSTPMQIKYDNKILDLSENLQQLAGCTLV